MLLLVVYGAIGGLLTIALLVRCLPQRYNDVLTVLLAVIAAIYIGPAVGQGGLYPSAELAFAIFLIAWSVAAQRKGLVFLAIGYLLHAIWDGLHGALLPHSLPHWYAPICVGYDVAVAACIMVRHSRQSASQG